jgi:predicted DCC family thiol-disulfide oxidoreductase YuxK
VQFVIKHDKAKRFLFSLLQSAAGEKLKDEMKAGTGKDIDSVVLFYKNKYYTKSSAVLKTGWILGGIWGLSILGFMFPAFIRDKVYDWVARNRYKWFGKKNECMIPTPELQNRFL